MSVTQVLDLASLSASEGFLVQGAAPGDQAGVSVSTVGDINGDGIDDFIVGAWQRDNYNSGNANGEAYVIFGKAGMNRATIDLGNLSASDGFVVRGQNGFDLAGYSVSNAGDINGDGFDDLIVGGYNGNPAIIFGKAGATRADIDLSSLAATDGFRVIQEYSFHRIGASVTGVGDINGDGIEDFALGGRGAGAAFFSFTGSPFVIFGKAGATRPDITLATLAPSDGFVIENDGQDEFAGWSISGAGDVNGDGIADLIFGGPRNSDGGNSAGEAYVIFGKIGATRPTIDLAALAPGDGFRMQGDAAYDQAGLAVSNAGDVNGDGFDDLIVGAIGGDDGGNFAGEAYVIFGKSGATRANIDLSTFAANDGFAISGGIGFQLGFSVSNAGDVDGDGIDDLIVGTFSADSAYVIYGQVGATRSNINVTNLSLNDGFTIRSNVTGDQLGWSVSAAGDINGDGKDDLIVGARLADHSGMDAGEAYVIYGSAHRNIGTIIGTAGVDNIVGTAGRDEIDALGGNDVLDGGAGDDMVRGGAGNDIYVVDSVGDTVIELSGDGIDSIETTVTDFILPDNVENLEFTGTIAFSGTGNSLANVIVGGNQGDKLNGLDGDDTLGGEAGDDILTGGTGNDRLVGGVGDDIMNGGDGNDILVVDSIGDVAVGGAGTDTVQIVTAGLTYSVAADIEIISNLSGGNASVTLNTLANSYGGSNGVDIVMAGGGNDMVYGRAGEDQLFGGDGNDRLFGESGQDTLSGDDGDDLLYGGTGPDLIQGGNGNDTLYGDTGTDKLIGGAGRDLLYGGSEADTFRFDAVGDSGATIAIADRILDFSGEQGDRIDLSPIDANSTGGGASDAFTFIGSGTFTGVAGQLRAAVSGGQTLVSGDVNGDGVADFLIRIDGIHTLVAGDFAL